MAEKKRHLFHPIIYLIIFMFGFAHVGNAQFIDYSNLFDYHREESPSVSWNGLTFSDPRSQALAGISLLPGTAFAAMINPATYSSRSPVTSLGLTAEFVHHEAYQYWGRNQGVFGTADNSLQNTYAYGGVQLNHSFSVFRLSFGWRTVNLYELPSFHPSYTYWSYRGDFPGIERGIYLSAGKTLSNRLSLGIKIEYIYGKRRADIVENFLSYPASNSRFESNKWNYWSPTIGAVWDVTEKFQLGASINYPLQSTVNRSVRRSFRSEEITIENDPIKHTDPLIRPARGRFGFVYSTGFPSEGKFKKSLSLAGEILYTRWAGYGYTYYGETIPREMKNTLSWGLAAEARLALSDKELLLRLGYRNDPQPLQNPIATLRGVSGGLGLRIGRLGLDAALAVYRANIADLQQTHVQVSAAIFYFVEGGSDE